MLFDPEGNLYGTTGGGPGAGTVFELTPTSGGGWKESILYAFSGGPDGALPGAALIFDKAGNLYGTAQYGGDLNCGDDPPGCGVVFELTRQADGSWKEVVLYAFPFLAFYFLNPSTSVVMDSRGDLYGTTASGGASDNGSVFRLSRDKKGNWNYETLYSFVGGSDGSLASSGLIFVGAHKLYGTTASGGVISGKTLCPHQSGCGTIFELTPNSGGVWMERVLHEFTGGRDGSEPVASLFSDGAGNLYSTASGGGGGGCGFVLGGCGALLKLSPVTGGKWSSHVLYEFVASDGMDPQVALTTDSSGNFYGVTNAGGKGNNCEFACGTVFKLTRSTSGNWIRTVLYSFTGINGDGAFPKGNVTFDTAGNLYGTTQFGGAKGMGTVFELMPSSGGGWKIDILYSFAGGSDGVYPTAGLIFDSAGNLYGTTSGGGVGYSSCGFGCGTVFKLSPSGNAWKETVLYSFTGANGDGVIPVASLILDDAGNLYGTTSFGGGSGNCGNGGCGTAFQLSRSQKGWTETVLHAFGSNSDGASPLGSLNLDETGDLYGTTWAGGTGTCKGGVSCGIAFKLTRHSGSWIETIIHNFGSHSGDGVGPAASLTFDVAGNLYGTTTFGGAKDLGTVFQLAPVSGGKWTESIVHSFTGYPSDGGYPTANLNIDADGNLYGTTNVGGEGGGVGGYPLFPGGGTIFEITP